MREPPVPPGFDPRPFQALALVLALAAAALALRPADLVWATPFTEDGFYALSVARNIAAGLGVTADGTQPTNGFQPLFTFLCAGIYRLTQGDEAWTARGVILLSWAIWLGAAALLGLIARDLGGGTTAERRARAWTAALLHLGAFLVLMHSFNGLETGLVLLLYALIWRAWQTGMADRPSGVAALGMLFGLLILARIDAAVILAAVCLWDWLGRADRLGALRALQRPFVIGGIALLVAAPWLAYNQIVLGSLMPTSGAAQTEWAFDPMRWRWIGWALGVSALPGLWLGRLDETPWDGAIPAAIRAAALLGLAWWTTRACWRRGWQVDDQALRFPLMMLAGLAALAVFYGASFIAYWFYYRYLFPLEILAAVGIAWVAGPWAAARPRAALTALAVLALPTLISLALAQSGRTLHVDTVYREQLRLIERHVEADVPVAAGQTGTLGYFRLGTINVDGKVNRAAIAWQDRMWEYLAANDVRWFCDWDFYVRKYLGPDPTTHGWRLHAEAGPWQLWRRE